MTPNQPQAQRAAPSPESLGLPKAPHKRGGWESKRDLLTLGGHIGTNVLLFVVALLIAALAWLSYSAKPASQAKYVDSGKLQAIFLNTGQVYFGTIASLNKDYYVLSNVYYLQSDSNTSASKTSNQNLSLIKLGCELHKPYDQMVINASDVTFWENLQQDGQVAKAVDQFKQQNPNGQKCSSTPAASNSNNLQNPPSTKSSSNQ